MKKRIVSILMAIVMLFTPLLFAGCGLIDGVQNGIKSSAIDSLNDYTNGTGSFAGSGSSGSSSSGSGSSGSSSSSDDEDYDPTETNVVTKYFDGFKVVYSKSLKTGKTGTKKELTNELYDNAILIPLDNFYGSGSENENLNTFFPDSIRQLIVRDKASVSNNAILDTNGKAWKWTLGDGDFGKNDVKLVDNENNPKSYKNYVNQFIETTETLDYPLLSDYYAIAIQIVLFETMLGYKEKTTFKPVFDGDNNKLTTIEIVSCPNNVGLNGKAVCSDYTTEYVGESYNALDNATKQKVDRIKQEVVTTGDYLTELQNKYYTTATYSGLTKADADSFIDYILDKVIGIEVVCYDYETYGPNQTDYREVTFETQEEREAFEANPNPNLYNVLKKEGEDYYNYYNYRNYVGRVAEMVYSQVFDGEGEYKYTYERTYNRKTIKFEYDFVKNKNTSGKTGADLLLDIATWKAEASFRPKSVSFLSDYEVNAFFESENAFNMFGEEENTDSASFDNSPLAEYQSVVVMQQKEDDFGGMLMEIFSPNPDLAINLRVRCYLYDESTGKGILCEWKTSDEINFYHDTSVNGVDTKQSDESQDYVPGKGYLYKTTQKDNDGNPITGYFTDFEVNVNLSQVPEKYQVKGEDLAVDDIQIDRIVIGKFNNYEEKDGVRMKAQGESVNGRVEASLDVAEKPYAYKIIQSQNGFGGITVLDETKAGCSYFELVFDIEKDPTLASQNYDFKLAIILPM